VAGAELLLLLLDESDFADFSEEPDDVLSLELELELDSLLDDDPLVELLDFLPDSRLSVR
jgi:hypothetical protein